MAHGEHFREQVLTAVDEGATHKAVAGRFGVSTSSIRSWLSERRKSKRPRILPVRVTEVKTGRVELEIDGVVVRLLDGAAPDYVAELVRALRSC
jgi:transposase-like protein